MMTHDVLDELLLDQVVFREMFALQRSTIQTFHELARRIAGAPCPIAPPSSSLLCIERNFFSTYFLTITRCLVGDSPRLPLYAMVNQGMRAWVTACDNILDDEYKEIFAFRFPGQGRRMRSVLTLLLADRVVTEFVVGGFNDDDLPQRVGRVSLAALLPSARQESEEEQRPVPILPVNKILNDIHKRKTGDLFAAPLALPIEIEHPDPRRTQSAWEATVQFGLACQILDDIKDMPEDVRAGRHNLLLSIVHGDTDGEELRERLGHQDIVAWTAWERFPGACAQALDLAEQRFHRAFEALKELGITLNIGQRAAVQGLMCRLLGLPLAEMRGRREAG